MVVGSIQASLVTALIAAGSSLSAVFISYWLPERRRRRDEVGKQREQAAQVTEPVRNLLIDAKRVRNEEEADAIRTRWVKDLRDPFTVFGMAQGSADVSAVVLRLREAVGDYLDMLGTSNPRQHETLATALEMIRDLRAAYGAGMRNTKGEVYARPLSIYRPGYRTSAEGGSLYTTGDAYTSPGDD